MYTCTFAYKVTMKLNFLHVHEYVIFTTFPHGNLYWCTMMSIKWNKILYSMGNYDYIVGCIMNYLSGVYAMHSYLVNT